MNREIEERIVAMYFDNQDFEKNAKQTLETLGQLKEGLDLDDAAKGFNVFDKIKNAMNLSKANREAKTLRSTMSSLTSGISKVANIGTAPVRALDSLFNTFRGYVGKFIGFDLAGKVVNTLESTMRSFTIAPVSAGWDQYQAKMDSVKTIMSGTGESIEVVEQHLKNLTDYANKTIYSLSDMTSNLGKFTNNGVKLEEATAAMQGIANATADAGQGAQSASMAMYNISQAIGVGKMTTIDWKSLENANIATQKLKNTFLEVAAAGGRIQKETDGKGVVSYWLTKDDDGKELKEKVELTAANFREYLQKGWLDKDTMLKTFQIYSGQGITVDLLKSWGIDDVETQKRLMEIGEEALNAAQEVRTFSKMMDALRESAQSGWADSFQIIFGNMEQGTTLWTRLSEEIDKVLTGSANKRNEVLTAWTEMSETYDSIYNGTDEKGNKRKVKEGGRQILIDSFFEMIDVIKEVGKVFSDTFHKVFGEIDAKKLMDVTLGFRNLVRGAREWLGDVNKAGSRLNKISRTLSGVFNVIKIGFNVIKAGFNLVKRLAGPAIDVFLDVFSTIGDFLTGTGELNFGQLFAKIGEGFSKLWDKIKGIFMPRNLPGGGTELPIITWIKERWQSLKNVIREWANDTGLGDLLTGFTGFVGTIVNWDGWNRIAEFFVSAKDTIVNAWNTVKTWDVWENIGEFLTNTWNWVLGILGLNGNKEDSGLEKKKEELAEQLQMEDGFEGVAPENQGFFAGLIQSLNNAWGSVKEAWDNTVGSEDAKNNLWIPIANFFTDTWKWICDTAEAGYNFFTKPQEGENGETGSTGFVAWIKEVWASITTFWEEFKKTVGPVGEDIVEFFQNTWDWICGVVGKGVEFFTKPDGDTGETGFVAWIRGIWESIEKFWNETILGTAKPIWQAIASFTTDTWGWIKSQFTVKRYDERGFELSNQKAPIETWLSGIWESVKGVWNDIVAWEGWKAIGDFLSNTWGWITDLFKGSEASVAGASAQSIKMAEKNADTVEDVTQKGGFLERIITSVGDFFARILNAINGVIIPPEVTTFLTNLTDFVGGVLTAIGNVLGIIGRIVGGHGSATDVLTVLGGVVVGVVGILLKFRLTKLMADVNMQSIGLQFLEIAGGFLLISAALSLMTTIDQGKMWIAVGALTVMGAVIGFIMKFFLEKNFTQNSNQTPVKAGERILKTLIDVVGKIGMIAVVLALLPNVIKAFGEAKALSNGESFGQEILDTFLGLSAFVGVVSVAFMVIEKVTGSKGLDPKATGKTLLSILEVFAVVSAVMLAIGGLGEAADGIFGEGTHDKIIAALDKAAAFFHGFGKVINRFLAGLFGIQSDTEKAEESMAILEMIGDKTSVFDLEKISGISRILTMIQQVTDGSIKFDTGKMKDFASTMGELGSGIYEIAGYIGEVEGPLSELHNPDSIMFKKLEGFTSFGKQLGDMLLTFTNVHIGTVLDRLHTLATAENSKQFVNDLNVILRSLGDLDDPTTGIQFDGLTIATKLFDAVQEGLTDKNMPAFDATSVVDAIVKALTVGDTAIGLIVHEMVQKGINLSDKNRDGEGFTIGEDLEGVLQQVLNGKMTNPAELIDLSGIETQLFGDNGEGGLLGYFNTFESKMPDFETIFKDKLDFKDAEGNDFDILGEIQTQMDNLSATLNEMDPLTVKITPVFDMQNFTPETLQQQLDAMPIQFTPGTTPNKVSIEFKGLSEELNLAAIRHKLEEIRFATVTWGSQTVVATNRLGADIDAVAAEISRMKLYLDTGALVGGILPMVDAGLYRRSVTASRTGTVSMN